MQPIRYTSPAAPLPVGGPITPIPPAVAGTGFTYAISPGLPAGMGFDPAAGIISGTPTGTSTGTGGTTAYTVTATNGGGSISTVISITVNGALGAFAPITRTYGDPTDAVAGTPVQLQARTFGSGYWWQPAHLLNNAATAAPLATLQQNAEVTVRITESSTGCVVPDTLPLRVHLGWQISMPDVFTPNGDGHNDVIKPVMPNINTFSSFRVFNRWGNLIFEIKEKTKAGTAASRVPGNPRKPTCGW